MKSEKIKTVYYGNECEDDFAGTNINSKTVDKNFKYIHKNVIWRALAFIAYYFIAYPLVWLYERVILRVKFVNKKALKAYKKQSSFYYGNHTGFIDAFTPNIMSVSRRNKIIVNADSVSIKGLKNIVQMLGALPVPTEMNGFKNFVRAIDYYHKKCNITIYPEAHIWPYFTGVRNFSDASFNYPIKYGAPTFAFFTAYTKPKGFLSFLRKANVTVYISDPIFCDEGLTGINARKNLRDKVYNFMVEKSKLSTYEVIRYVKVDGDNSDKKVEYEEAI